MAGRKPESAEHPKGHNKMKLLFASDSFKGTLSSEKTALLLEKAARDVFGEVECISVPVADGGEGTTDAILSATHGEKIDMQVHGPLMKPASAYYGRFGDHRAIIEMAAASGLPMVPPDLRNPLYTTTYGTGELIRNALDHGLSDLFIAIGGSATNDGGMGCSRALGIRFLDKDGNELEGKGEDLERVCSIDMSGLDPRIRSARITVLCDVTNPLCGKNGATCTFSARKSGIETVLDLIDFDKRLEGVDLVVTGEGRTDWQSCFGKVMQGIGKRARAKGIPAVGLSGSLGKDACQIFDYGIDSLMTTVDAPMPLEEALSRAEELYSLGAIRMFRMIRTGMEIRQKPPLPKQSLQA